MYKSRWYCLVLMLASATVSWAQARSMSEHQKMALIKKIEALKQVMVSLNAQQEEYQAAKTERNSALPAPENPAPKTPSSISQQSIIGGVVGGAAALTVLVAGLCLVSVLMGIKMANHKAGTLK